MAAEFIAIPALNDIARNARLFLAAGNDTAIVGPPGCGTTTLASVVEELLADGNISCCRLDCRPTAGAAEPAVARMRKLISESEASREHPPVLVIDHAADLAAEELVELGAAVEGSGKQWRARLWLGNLDCRAIQKQHKLVLHSQPRAHLLFPELEQNDLLQLYRKISDRRGCRWGETLLYFVLDWCGGDLVLVDHFAERFFGDWSNYLYDDAVADCLKQWLESDVRVAAYRQRVNFLPRVCSRHRHVLSSGGKLPRHVPEFLYETDEATRSMFLAGLLSANLLAGYYTTRHLLARYIIGEAIGTYKTSDAFSLFRRAANERVSALLQDVELALRRLLLAVFETYPTEDWCAWLGSKKTDEQFMAPQLQKALLAWALEAGGESDQGELREKLGRFLSERRKEFEKSHNLWTALCERYLAATITQESANPPSLIEAVDYLTFNEVADLVQSLQDKIFVTKSWERLGVDAPKQRWPSYFSRIRRLRNAAAHLRNLSFQDVEDLLRDLRSLREDLYNFAFSK